MRDSIFHTSMRDSSSSESSKSRLEDVRPLAEHMHEIGNDIVMSTTYAAGGSTLISPFTLYDVKKNRVKFVKIKLIKNLV